MQRVFSHRLDPRGPRPAGQPAHFYRKTRSRLPVWTSEYGVSIGKILSQLTPPTRVRGRELHYLLKDW